MKVNQKIKKYSKTLIKSLQAEDEMLMKEIRFELDEVTQYARQIISDVIEASRLVRNSDIINYAKVNSKSKLLSSKITRFSDFVYFNISVEISKNIKKSYINYRKLLTQSLSDLNISINYVDIKEGSVSFNGSNSKSYDQQVLSQLQAGSDPAMLIKTVSQEHVKVIQRHVAVALSKGNGFNWTKDRIIREILPAGVANSIKMKMERDILRILRSSYMNAINNDTADLITNNPGAFYGGRRVADGRPCIACISQDGKFYPPGRMLIDHPNGQCLLSPLSYPLEYLQTGKITKAIYDPIGLSLKDKFYRASAAKQMLMMGNKSLYRLWKKDQFDLDKLVLSNGNPMSYQKALAELPKLNGISYTKVGYFNAATKNKLNYYIDPIDRGNDNFKITTKKPDVHFNSYGLDSYGDGSDFLNAKVPSKIKARIMSTIEPYIDNNPLKFNEKARLLNLGTRKSLNQTKYYMIKEKP